MLTEAEGKYIKKLPDTPVVLQEYSPCIDGIYHVIDSHFRENYLKGTLSMLGSCGLKLPFSDVDLYFASPEAVLAENYDILTILLGPGSNEIGMYCWNTVVDDQAVEIYLTGENNPLYLQQRAFQLMLRTNPDMRQEYAGIKKNAAAHSLLRSYTAQKFGFWNTVLTEYNRRYPKQVVPLDTT